MADTVHPLVCICIPAYNAEKTIAATLRSVLGQTYTKLVVQVVDNQSSDNTIGIVESFNDPRLVLHRNPVNLGGEGNFNRCIELATGKYTAIYHADDIYEPDTVAAQVKFLEAHPQAAAVFTEALLIDETGREIGKIRQPAALAALGPLHDFQTIFKAVLEHSNFLICPSVMALTHIYQHDIKAWRGDRFGSSADLDVWFRMAKGRAVGILSLPGMRYRISGNQGSASVRLDTERAAFFSVMDHYLDMDDVQVMLTQRDRENYERLERRDRVMRAINALIKNEPGRAAELCPTVFSLPAIQAAVQTRRGFAVFTLSAFLRLMLFLRLRGWAKAVLSRFKKMTNR